MDWHAQRHVYTYMHSHVLVHLFMQLRFRARRRQVIAVKETGSPLRPCACRSLGEVTCPLGFSTMVVRAGLVAWILWTPDLHAAVVVVIAMARCRRVEYPNVVHTEPGGNYYAQLVFPRALRFASELVRHRIFGWLLPGGQRQAVLLRVGQGEIGPELEGGRRTLSRKWPRRSRIWTNISATGTMTCGGAAW